MSRVSDLPIKKIGSKLALFLKSFLAFISDTSFFTKFVFFLYWSLSILAFIPNVSFVSKFDFFVLGYSNFRIDEKDIAAELKKSPWREGCGKRWEMK